jgi:hypothetical protein
MKIPESKHKSQQRGHKKAGIGFCQREEEINTLLRAEIPKLEDVYGYYEECCWECWL